jgi:hypothetical protein
MNSPPQTALTSVWSSAWMLGLHPNWNVIAACYNTDFAEDKIGGPARDILERHGEKYFGVRVDQSSRSRKRWKTTVGGGLVAVGVDKPVTGRRGDFIVLDDVYADFAAAMNAKYRADIVDWFQANVLFRRPEPLRMTATMSRWTDDDFIAWILNVARENGWRYRLMDFPAIAVCRVSGCPKPEPQFTFGRDEDTGFTTVDVKICDHKEPDELGRVPGKALWPRVRPLSFLLRQLMDSKSEAGGSIRKFLALFQGRPQKAGGSTFKEEWFRYFRRVGDMIELLDANRVPFVRYSLAACKLFEIVDLAAGDTTTLRSGITRTKPKSDFTVIGNFALCPRNELAVLNIYRSDKLEGPDQIAMVAKMRGVYGAGRIGIEAVAYQWTAVQAAVRSGLPAVAITRGNESKETRAWTIAARYEMGQVFHLLDSPWVEPLESELVAIRPTRSGGSRAGGARGLGHGTSA